MIFVINLFSLISILLVLLRNPISVLAVPPMGGYNVDENIPC